MHDQGLLVIRLQANPELGTPYLLTHSFANRVWIHSCMKSYGVPILFISIYIFI